VILESEKIISSVFSFTVSPWPTLQWQTNSEELQKEFFSVQGTEFFDSVNFLEQTGVSFKRIWKLSPPGVCSFTAYFHPCNMKFLKLF
jgi:hypothetical protein